MCQWTQDTSDNIDWVRKSGSTLSSNTGPSNAHDGTHYIYIETSSGAMGDRAVLTSPLLLPNDRLLKFWYHMYGVNINKLSVEGQQSSDNTWIELWSHSQATHSSSSDPFVQQTVPVPASYLRLRFIAVRGSGYRGDIAIDAVSVEIKVADNIVHLLQIQVHPMHTMEHIIFTSKQAVL